MITKSIVKDYVLRKCKYLSSVELNDKAFIELLKSFSEVRGKYLEKVEEENQFNPGDSVESYDIKQVLKEHPEFKKELNDFNNSIERNAVEEMIDEYVNDQLISELSRKYFELVYGEDKCVRCDIDKNKNEIIDQTIISNNTKHALSDKNIKVIFEGQIEFKDLRARFDVLIRNEDDSFDLIEVKGTKSVLSDGKTTIKSKYLYDVLFQYFVYKNNGLPLNRVGLMHLNEFFELQDLKYPASDNDLHNLFLIDYELLDKKSGPIEIKEFFDKDKYTKNPDGKIENIINEIRTSTKLKPNPCKNYNCLRNGTCPFLDICFKDADDSNSIFKLTRWSKNGSCPSKIKKLMEDGVEYIANISQLDVDNKFNDIKSNVRSQIEFAKRNIKEKYIIDLNLLKTILNRDYLSDEIDYLIFFDFESFSYPLPLVKNSYPYEQVVCQYSMHIVNKSYDLSKHDFKKGNGGNIKHFEFIGNPDKDLYENPSVELYKTLLDQIKSHDINPKGNNYRVIVYNKTYEQGRMNDFVKNFKSKVSDNLIEFVDAFNNNVVDLMDFFTNGALYCKDFNGRASLKVVQPVMTEDKDVLKYYKNLKLPFDFKDSLDYHKGDKCLVYNGAICLDLYKSLLIRSHLNKINKGLPTNLLLDEARAYCKIDSWGTVIIFDIIRNIVSEKIKLDAKYR